MSFETHGKIDALFAASSPLMPRLYGFEDTPAAAIFKANAFVEGAVVAITDFNSAKASAASKG